MLTELRAAFRAKLNREDRVTCPVCDHKHIRCRRKFSKSMAVALIAIYHHYSHHPEEPLKVPAYLSEVLPRYLNTASNGGDYAKLVTWGLLEPDTEHGSGHYWITKKGIDFVELRCSVPKYRWELSGTQPILDENGPYISIEGALGNLNYRRLMDQG